MVLINVTRFDDAPKTVLTQNAFFIRGANREVTVEETIQAILCKCPEVTEGQILAALETEKSKTGGLIADETLLRLIAARYGVETVREAIADCRLSIKHLVPGLNRVTVSGRIVAVYPAKVFEGKISGKYASLIIADQNELLRIMLWNSKADLVESGVVKVGQVTRFLRGYTREDRNGKTELHLSDKGEVEVNPDGSENDDYPFIDRFATGIKEITKPNQSLHLVGRVKEIFPSSTFTRQDNSTGKVMRLIVADNTGEISVIAWNEKAEELEPVLKRDLQVRLVNAKAKENSNGVLEVHVDAATYVEVA
jgi:ssDNA-binding replication factor A large subunit